MADNEKPVFDLISSAEPLALGNNIYYVSKQKITQPSGSASEHLVVKKQPVGADKSPSGQVKQLYIPLAEAGEVLKHANAHLNQKDHKE